MHISNGTETEEDGRGQSKAIHNSTPFIGTKNTATWDSLYASQKIQVQRPKQGRFDMADTTRDCEDLTSQQMI